MSDLINDQMDKIKVIKNGTSASDIEAEIQEKEIARLKKVCEDYAKICACYQQDIRRYQDRVVELENSRS